ncbi:unnamed protein product, partial [Prorocentrum cordatum]
RRRGQERAPRRPAARPRREVHVEPLPGGCQTSSSSWIPSRDAIRHRLSTSPGGNTPAARASRLHGDREAVEEGGLVDHLRAQRLPGRARAAHGRVPQEPRLQHPRRHRGRAEDPGGRAPGDIQVECRALHDREL